MTTAQKPFRKGMSADAAPPSDHDRLESLERRVANLAIAVVDQPQQAMRNDAPPPYNQIDAAGGTLGATKPASAPSVHDALGRNWRAVDALLTAVGELEQRLNFASIPAPAVEAATCNTMPPEPNCGPLLTELNSLSSRIEDQAVRLTAMTARLTL